MAAEAAETDEPVETVQVVEFTLGTERFAVGVGEADQIVEHEGATRVPRTSEAITGVIDLRGEITAIIDPRVYLDVPREYPDEQQVLVLAPSKDKQNLGLLVDEVIGVEEYPESDVEPPEAIEELDTTGVREAIITSIIRRPSEDADFEPVARLDVDAIVAQSRQGTRTTRD